MTVSHLRLVEKRLLAGDLAFTAGGALLLQRGHHCLQPVHQGGHDVRLPLQQLERLFALMRVRIDAQRRSDLGVERLNRLQPLTPAQRGQQPQHGRRGHTGNRGAEREPQALDRRRQRRANRLQVGGALQRGARALERHHHAEQRPQHAQQDKQTHQIRRQRGAGQRNALAFHAQAHGVAQARMQLLQPGPQLGRLFRQPGHGLRERAGGLLIAAQLQRTCHVGGANHDGDDQRERVEAHDIACRDPPQGHQPGKENDEIQVISGHGVLFNA